jgi:hypothetical protein
MKCYADQRVMSTPRSMGTDAHTFYKGNSRQGSPASNFMKNAVANVIPVDQSFAGVNMEKYRDAQ